MRPDPTSIPAALHTVGLSKAYGPHTVLDEVTIRVEPGEIEACLRGHPLVQDAVVVALPRAKLAHRSQSTDAGSQNTRAIAPTPASGFHASASSHCPVAAAAKARVAPQVTQGRPAISNSGHAT